MGFLKKVKKAVKKVAKVAIKTSPMWSSFVPGGGFAMTLVRQGLKVGAAKGNPSPSAKNRFPLPNPIYQGGPVMARAQRIARTAPAPRGRAGPFAQGRGMATRARLALSSTTRVRTLTGRAKKRAHMRRMIA